MSMDPTPCCWYCNQNIGSSAEAHWLWHRDKTDALSGQVGPMHTRCASEVLHDSPNHFFRTESDMHMYIAMTGPDYVDRHGNRWAANE